MIACDLCCSSTSSRASTTWTPLATLELASTNMLEKTPASKPVVISLA